MPLEIKNKKEFDDLIANSTIPLIFDFWAPWCHPCRQLSPLIDKLSEEKANFVTVAKVNVDDNPDISDKYNIQSIPTLLGIKDKSEADNPKIRVGLPSKVELDEFVNGIIYLQQKYS